MPYRTMVSDVDRSTGFYELLGFVVAERWGPAFAILEREGHELWLSGPGTSAAKPMPDGRVPVPGGWNRLVLVVPDAAALAVEISNAGFQLRNEPLSGPGGTQVLVEDPDGNPVELFTPA